MIAKTLAQLYAEHEGKVSDKWSLYLQEYDRIFSVYRAKPIIILEIGIQNGGSLEIWAKYFSNGKKFIGCDIDPECSCLKYDDPRIVLVIGDANTDATQAEILQHCPKFDIVIDDGSHQSSDIVKSFARYFPKIKNGGVFVAEDLHCSYWQEFEGGLFNPYSSITFFKHLADVLNHEHWGVEKRRTDIFKGFFKMYGFALEETMLKQVHSVEFINSACIVRKSSIQRNVLGDHIFAGNIDAVVPGLRDLPFVAPSETHNFWSSRELSPSEELPVRLNELSELDRQIVELNQAVSERDGQIVDLSQTLSERDGQIVDLSQTLSERDGQIVDLSQTLSERDGQIVDLSQTLSERDGQIVDLSQTLSERDGQIVELNQAVTERDGQIVDLSQTLSERDGQIGELNQAVSERDYVIQHIFSSRSWSVTRPLRFIGSFFRKR